MKPLLITASVSLLLLTGCDTPMAAAKREKLGITWEEWQKGIRTKEAKENADGDERRTKAFEIEREVDHRKEYVAAHPNLSPPVAQAILKRELARGMNAEEVYLVWGYPNKVNKSVGGFGEHQQWVFGGGRYAYFQNGVLDSWQTSE